MTHEHPHHAPDTRKPESQARLSNVERARKGGEISLIEFARARLKQSLGVLP